jgi:hypothetical protein
VFLVEHESNHSNGRYSVWIMDSSGREYTSPFDGRGEDSLREFGLRLLESPAATQQEFQRAIAKAKPTLPSVSPDEMTRAITLLAASRTGTVVTHEVMCRDGISLTLYGFQLSEDGRTFLASLLRSVGCGHVTRENDSPAARRLALWVDQLQRRGPPH